MKKRLRSLIKEWNEGKVPQSKAELRSLNERINNALASGFYAFQQNNLEELRYMKFEINKEINSFNPKKRK